MTKPTLSSILSVCAAICGTTLEKASDPLAISDSANRARLVFMYCTRDRRMGRRAVTCGIDPVDAKTIESRSIRLFKASLKFQYQCNQAIREIEAMQKMLEHKPRKQKPNPVYTIDEEERMRQACIESIRFMRAYGRGYVVNPHTDGTGYYPFPRMLE